MAGDRADVWMPLFIGDYLADTQRLTTEQHGAYLLLIMDYWRNGPPPNDDAVLAQITRMQPAAWKKARAAVVALFTERDGNLVHKRIEQELSDSQSRKEKAVAKAKVAAEKRWGKQASEHATSNAPSMPQAMPEDVLKECPSPSPSPIHKPSVSEQTPRASRSASKRKPGKTTIPDDFGLSDKVLDWAQKNGHTQLQSHLDHFIGCAKAKGYTYVDWDQALQNAIRDNWARIGMETTAKPTKFDPLAYVLRNQRNPHDDQRTIDIEAVRVD